MKHYYLLLNSCSYLILHSIAATYNSLFSFTPFCLGLLPVSDKFLHLHLYFSVPVALANTSFHSVLGSILDSALLSPLLPHQSFSCLVQDHLITFLATAFLRTSL